MLEAYERSQLPFQILCLPEVLIRKVIRSMDVPFLIGFSMISKRCRDLVKTCIDGINANIRLTFGHQVAFNVLFGTAVPFDCVLEIENKWERGLPTIKMSSPYGISIYDQEKKVHVISRPGYEMSAWTRHFLWIFYKTEVSDVEFTAGSERFDIDSIKETFKNLLYVFYNNPRMESHCEAICTKLAPIDLRLEGFKYSNTELTHKLLNQNYEFLQLKGVNSNSHLKLEHLLVNNSKSLSIISNTDMSESEFNKFFKCWATGSNPQMEHLSISLHRRGVMDVKVLFSRIKFEIQPETLIRKFRFSFYNRVQDVKGGYDIKGLNGLKATIIVKDSGELSGLTMFVWHDMCTVRQ